MAIVVVGGHSRNIGKTSVVAGLISAMPEMDWLAIKITQYGHGVCSANGEPCDCQPGVDEHEWAITAERKRDGGSDTSRFLIAGAKRSLWVRTRQGMLAEAMPRLRESIEEALRHEAKNVIVESNSILRFLKPDVYLSVLDHSTADFKASAREYLDRADAVLLREEASALHPQWDNVSLKIIKDKRIFNVREGDYVPRELVKYVRERMAMQRSVDDPSREPIRI